MKEFRDNTGARWPISVTVESVKRVRDLCDGIDLLSLATPGNDLLLRLEDPCSLVGVLYALCKPEIDKRGVTPEAFGEMFTGEHLEEATTALLEEIIEFFPSKKRQILHHALRKVIEVGEKKKQADFDRAMKQIESPEFEDALSKALDKVYGV